VKQTRGWQWIDPAPWLKQECNDPAQRDHCPCSDPQTLGEKVGLLWVGAEFYNSPGVFMAEAITMGVSRRLKAVPRGFRAGKTWVFLAHPKACQGIDPDSEEIDLPGVFSIIRPDHWEKIVTESQAQDPKFMKALEDAQIYAVVVPDSDKDHQGSVHDKEEREHDDTPQNFLPAF